MREALNENPVIQAVVIGVLLLGAAGLLLMQMGGGGDGGSSPTASATVTGPGAATSEVSVTDNGDSVTAGLSTTVPTTGASLAPTPVAAAPAEFKAGPGLPRRLVSDHDRGKTIVLLVSEPKGIEDADLRAAVNGLRGDADLAVYITEAKGIARYAQITQGVGVAQVPALIVVSPNTTGGSPRATVSYGFRSSDSVRQAVRDAVYRGDPRGYDPG